MNKKEVIEYLIKNSNILHDSKKDEVLKYFDDLHVQRTEFREYLEEWIDLLEDDNKRDMLEDNTLDVLKEVLDELNELEGKNE